MEYLGKRFVIVSCVLIFIVSPVAATALVTATRKKETPITTVQPATKEELFTAIKQDNNNPAASQKFEDVTDITSVKQLNTWWYVATVKTTSDDGYDPGPQGMLFVKFTDQPNSVRVVTKPGESFNHYNISDSAGVPYDVIDELNEVNDATTDQ